MPFIPPLVVNNCLISDFKAKASIFNIFFRIPMPPLENNNVIHNSYVYVTDTKIDSDKFNDNDITKLIRKLDTNKAHGHGNISIRLIKLCDSAIVKTLSVI